jgi:hypothetical protein
VVLQISKAVVIFTVSGTRMVGQLPHTSIPPSGKLFTLLGVSSTREAAIQTWTLLDIRPLKNQDSVICPLVRFYLCSRQFRDLLGDPGEPNT